MTALDIIGDIHGELDGLLSLLDRLGYARTADGFVHPAQRTLVFLGDLIDGSPHGLEVAELVAAQCEGGRALCLMGNHELNLLDAAHGGKVRHSNHRTFEDVTARPERWAPSLAFFRQLPLAVETPALRLVHAVWDEASLALLAPLLENQGPPPPAPLCAQRWWGSPFTDDGLHPALPDERIAASEERPHAVVVKGLEVDAASVPVTDGYGRLRSTVRECWWQQSARAIPRDKLIVFGHYHHHPPVDGDFTPTVPFGTEASRSWSAALAERVPREGQRVLHDDVGAVCIDFNVKAGHPLSRVGALRWPEREVVWAR